MRYYLALAALLVGLASLTFAFSPASSEKLGRAAPGLCCPGCGLCPDGPCCGEAKYTSSAVPASNRVAGNCGDCPLCAFNCSVCCGDDCGACCAGGVDCCQ